MKKVGDIVKILENSTGGRRRYVFAKVIQVIPKKKNNMYLCQNVVSGCRITVTDFDLKDRPFRGKKFCKEVI